MYDDIRYETDRGIAIVTIDRPEVHNAFTSTTVDELNDALRRADEDDGVYAIVLTGAEGGFCAGADVGEMPDWESMGKEAYASFLRDVQAVVEKLRTNPTPSIAAVGGPAIGAGCDFALACDVRCVGPDALLREGFVRVGLVPGDGGARLLPRLIGEGRAREYLLTGRDITAEDAVDLGLAGRVSEDARADAREIAAEIRALPRTAVEQTKALIDPDEPLENHCRRAIDAQWECVTDPEHAEAVAAFREKRSPEYDRDYA